MCSFKCYGIQKRGEFVNQPLKLLKIANHPQPSDVDCSRCSATILCRARFQMVRYRTKLPMVSGNKLDCEPKITVLTYANTENGRTEGYLFRRKCSKSGNKNRGGAVCLPVEITSQQHGRLMSTISETLELWGGPECTIVRIGDQFRNELEETGHLGRLEDLDAIAEVGIRTVRYPVLWETTSPHDPDECDWRWSDERLARLRELDMQPVAGLVHHGSGPRYTDLLDHRFPTLLARHAERVARRYPWIEMFTPVNEPLTTARFSGLYGHWYPHGRDQATFLRALVTECTAVVLAMRAIRTVRPDAKLVQTEDLGKAFGTPLLSYQAELENERRWLSLDLLCGRVDPHHPWHEILISSGIRQEELEFFREADAAPDIIGINHYLTSERFLDETLDRYPEWSHGGNPLHRYADVEAVRMDLPAGTLGPRARLPRSGTGTSDRLS